MSLEIPPEHRGKIYAALYLVLAFPLLAAAAGNETKTRLQTNNKRRSRPRICVQNAFAATYRLDYADTIASSFAARGFLSNSWWDEFLTRGCERNGSGGSAWRLEVSKMSCPVFEVLLVSRLGPASSICGYYRLRSSLRHPYDLQQINELQKLAMLRFCIASGPFIYYLRVTHHSPSSP